MEPAQVDIELWKTIDCFPLYQISSFGRVKSFYKYRCGKILSLDRKNSGYNIVGLRRKDGSKRECRVHILVAEAFIGQRPTPRHEVDHEDGNRSNNFYKNLSWKTRSGNYQNAVLRGTMPKHPWGWRASKLTKEQVIEIRATHQQTPDILQQTLATKYGVSRVCINNVLTNTTWKDVSCEDVGELK